MKRLQQSGIQNALKWRTRDDFYDVGGGVDIRIAVEESGARFELQNLGIARDALRKWDRVKGRRLRPGNLRTFRCYGSAAFGS